MCPRSASIAPFHLREGDHRIFVVGFPKELIVGDDFIPLCKPSVRRLISCQPNAVSNYLATGEYLFSHHRINDKLARLDHNWDALSK